MESNGIYTRRGFLATTAALGGAVALGWRTGLARAAATSGPAEATEEVSPAEDLMSEHGVLERLLLVYDHSSARLEASQPLSAPPVLKTVDLLRHFIEDYHEKLEEQHVFPRFEKAGRETSLVAVLLAQHRAGRRVTDRIGELLREPAPGAPGLAAAMRSFVRMYRPHAAREDTVLFRALRELMPSKDYLDLGETFEDIERERFGEGGFNTIVAQVVEIEKVLGINDLAQFTPA
jgi:hemerythrin-like domain-containing protein